MFFIVTVLFIGGNCFAQNENKFKVINDKLKKNEVKTQHPKKGIDPKTWIERGKLYQDAYDANLGLFKDDATTTMGLTTSAIILYFRGKDPKITSTTENDVLKETYEYSQITLHFENGRLRTWIETEKVVDNALKESINAYKKAQGFDTKNKNEKKIFEAFRQINADLDNKFFNEYNLELYIDAYNTALERIELNKHLNVTDTMYYFYAGYAAKSQSEKDSSMWQQSIDNFEKALSIGFFGEQGKEGQIYGFLYEVYKKIDNIEKALFYLKTGIEKFPAYDQLFFVLTQYYIDNDENDKALEFLDRLIDKDPKNVNLIFHKARQLYFLDDIEKALEAFDKAIAIDPNYYALYLGKADAYLKLADKSADLANDPKTSYADYEKYKNQYEDQTMQAIGPMEKAHELRPSDLATMENLKTLYFRLRVRFPELESKHYEMDKKLKEMQ